MQPMILAVAYGLLNPAQTVQTLTGTTPEQLAANAKDLLTFSHSSAFLGIHELSGA